MNKVILDASALLALLKQEKGKEIVKPLLKFSIMSTLNVCEAISNLGKFNFSTNEALEAILNIITEIIPFDIEHAKLAADIQTFTKPLGLSLGDRACIALGIHLKLPIYTADKIWGGLKLDNADIRLIR